MSDSDDAQHIKYIVEAKSEATAEVNGLVNVLGTVNARLAETQKLIERAFGLGNAQQVRQFRSALSTIAKGDLGTQVKVAAQSATLAKVRSDNSGQYLDREKAITKQLENQARLAGRFATQYDRLVDVSRRARSAAGPDLAKLQAEQQKIIDAVVSTMSGPTAAKQRKSMENIATWASPTALGRQQETQRYLNRLGLGFEREQTNRALEHFDARATSEQAVNTALKERIALLQQEKALKTQITSETSRRDSLNKSILRNFKTQRADELRGISDPAARRARYDAMLGGYRDTARTSGITIDETRLHDEYARVEKEIAAREARAASTAAATATRNAAAAQRKADADAARAAKKATAPEDAALAARARNNAFGGAALFATQGQLLSNYAAMAGVLGTIGFLTNYTIEFEKELKNLQAISTATNGEMKDLEKTVTDLSRASVFSAQELAEAATMMAQAGLSARQIGEALPAVAKLAVATGTDLKTTADTVTSTIAVFDLQTSEATRIANTLTAAMNLSKLSIDKYALGLQYSGNVAESVGIKYNELAAILAGMSNAGIKSGSTLGTGLRQLLLDIQSPTEKAKAVFSRVGLSSTQLDVESQGVFKVLRNLKDASLTTADATEAFEVRAVAAFKALMNNLPEVESLNQQITLTTAATSANAIQMDTLSAKWTKFASGAGSAVYKSTDAVRGALKNVLEVGTALTGVLQYMSPVITLATTAAVSFFAVWSVTKLLSIGKGLLAMAAAGRATATAMKLLSVTNVATAAITALALGISFFTKTSEDATNSLESYRETANRTKADFDETRERVQALDTAVAGLVARYGALSDDASPDLRAEINELMSRFGQYGLVLDGTTSKIGQVIDKTAELRRLMSTTGALQGQIALSAGQAEQEQITKAGAEQLLSGKVDGQQLPNLMKVGDLRQWLAVDARTKDAFPDRGQSLQSLQRLSGTYQGGFGADDLKNMSLEDVAQTQGRIAEMRAFFVNEQLKAKSGNSKFSPQELKDYIDRVDAAVQWSAALFNTVAKIRNKATQNKVLEGQVTVDRAGASTAAEAFQSNVSDMKGRLAADIENVFDVKKISEDRRQGALKDLQANWKEDIKGLNDARDLLFKRWQEEGLVKNVEEAKALFAKQPFADDFSYVNNALSRDVSKLDPAVKRIFKEQFEKAISAADAEARRVLEEAKVQNFNLPMGAEGNVVSGRVGEFDKDGKAIGQLKWTKRTLPESVKALESAFAKRQSNENENFRTQYPGAFETVDGKVADPSKAAEFLELRTKWLDDLLSAKAKLYAIYGKEFKDPRDAKKRKFDTELAALKEKRDEIVAKMAEIKGNVDGQSSADAYTEAMKAYMGQVGELLTVSAQITNMEWDDKTPEDAARAPLDRANALASERKKLQDQADKAMADLHAGQDDIISKGQSRLAKFKLANTETALNALPGDRSIISRQAAEARMQIGGALLDSMVDLYTEQFWKDPQNREKKGDQSVRDQLEENLSKFLLDRAKMIIDVSDQMVSNRAWADARGLASIDSRIGSYDNRSNRGLVGSTVRWGSSRDREAENTRVQASGIRALQDQRAILEADARKSQLRMALNAPGAYSNAAAQALEATNAKLADNYRALTQAQEAYATSTQKFAKQDPFKLMRDSIMSFIEAQGLMMNNWQQTADGLPQVFGTIRDSLQSTMGDIIMHTKDTGDAFREMGTSIERSLIDLGTKMITNAIIQYALRMIASLIGKPGTGDFSGGGKFDANAPVTGGRAQGGKITGGVPNRDSVLVPSMPGEFMMKKSAVDMIGEDNLAAMNATGQLATKTQLAVVSQKREADMVNVYVMQADQKPSLGPKDVVVTVANDLVNNGILKKLVKSVAVGGT